MSPLEGVVIGQLIGVKKDMDWVMAPDATAGALRRLVVAAGVVALAAAALQIAAGMLA